MKANFTLSDGDKAATDADGKVKAMLKGTRTGTHTVTASMVGGKSEQLVVNFTADTLIAQVNLNVTGDNSIANNIGMTRLQAVVTDGNGDPVEGIEVNFRGTPITLSNASIETDDQVSAEILVTSTEVGLKTVSVSLADKPTEVTSRLLSAKVDVNSATITSQGTPEDQVMVVQDIAVKAHVNNQLGNPATHQPVTFGAALSSQMITSQNTVSTNTQEVAEVTMTSERNGSYIVKVSLANGTSLGKQPEVIDEKLTLTPSPLIGVNALKGATLTATPTSANGTPVEGQVINFSVTLEGATLSGGKVRTNSSGQTPAVLINNRVGTYTVAAPFHNGVMMQIRTAVKVTDNPSTVHVASSIADPSTIAATNSDLNTLKVTAEDDSGNLVEGLTVYFALKSGSTALTSLTAVTDQSEIATISVKGTVAGSVTVSIVTSAGGMRTVDTSLVAGPVDTPQSIPKNNQSSLKGDFADSAELHLVLHDISGSPIKVSEGMEFVQSGTDISCMKISAIDYSQNINGDYKVTVTGGGKDITALIPVLSGVHQTGLSTAIEFISAETRPMMGTVSVDSINLLTASSPSQGFTGVYYQLNNDNSAPGKTATDYLFSSLISWVGVDATGKVAFKNDGDSNTVIIIAPSRSGGAIYQTASPEPCSV